MTAHNPPILLLEDRDTQRAELEIILRFLGETVIAAPAADWASGKAALQPKQAGESLTDEDEDKDESESSEAAMLPPPSPSPVMPIVIIGNCDSMPLTELLAQLHNWSPGVPGIVLGEGRIASGLKPRLASQVVANPAAPPRYQSLLDALHKARVFHEHYSRLGGAGRVRDFNMFRRLVGRSPALERVRYLMGQVADTEVSVLITGESGTGKEVVARSLHQNGTRAGKPFIPVNCGAIPADLLESELFGHEKGAFTGAVSSRAGRFELADGGTLFLDEIGDMPLAMQVKLLRVLQERNFERVGGSKTLHSDVRIIAATHSDLQQMINERRFRQDLYYRINVFPIEMPPLRERSEDIPLLINELISAMEAEERGSVRFNSGAIDTLCQYHWPGNVRELANLIERMAIMHPHGIVGANDLPEWFRSPVQGELIPSPVAEVAGGMAEGVAEVQDEAGLLPMKRLDAKEYLANLEKSLIERALDDCGGVVARAAERLKYKRTTLVEKMRKYNLQTGQ